MTCAFAGSTSPEVEETKEEVANSSSSDMDTQL